MNDFNLPPGVTANDIPGNEPAASFPPGIYSPDQIPMATYLADPCPSPSLSSGAAHRLLTQTPKHVHWTHPRLGGHPREASNRTDLGSVAHDLVLGGDGKICVIDPVDYPSRPTKDNPDGKVPDGWTNVAIRAARDEARANGLTPVLLNSYLGAQKMAQECAVFVAGSELAGVFDDGAAEVTAITKIGGVYLRARPDWVNHDRRTVVHYKTTEGSASPEPFIRWILGSMGYDVSLAFYRRVLESLADDFLDWQHVILVQEQAAPFACSIITLDPAMWAIASSKVDRAIATWGECLRSGNWPGYSPSLHYAAPSAWQLAQAEESLRE